MQLNIDCLSLHELNDYFDRYEQYFKSLNERTDIYRDKWMRAPILREFSKVCHECRHRIDCDDIHPKNSDILKTKRSGSWYSK